MSKYKGLPDTQILYVFALDILEILTPNGAWSTTDPAPLNVEQITAELEKVREHTRYKNQTLIVHADDMTAVILDKGIIRTEEP